MDPLTNRCLINLQEMFRCWWILYYWNYNIVYGWILAIDASLLGHTPTISFDDFHETLTTSEEDPEKERDASCSNSSIKNGLVYLSRDKDGNPTAKRLLRTTIPSGKEDKLKLEDCRNDIQSTEEDKSVEDNVNDKNIKQDKISSSKVYTM